MRSKENSVRKTLNISLVRRYEGEDLRNVLRNETLQNYLVENNYAQLLKRKHASSKIKNIISTRTERAMRKTLH